MMKMDDFTVKVQEALVDARSIAQERSHQFIEPPRVRPEVRRPLKRAIQNDLQNPLATRLLEGDFVDGDAVDVGLDGSKERLTFERAGGAAGPDKHGRGERGSR